MKLFVELYLSLTLTGTVPFCVYLLLKKWMDNRTTAEFQYCLLKFCILCYLFPFALLKSFISFIIEPNSSVILDKYLSPQNTILKTSTGFKLNLQGGFHQIFIPMWGILLTTIIVFFLCRYFYFRKQFFHRLMPDCIHQEEFSFQVASLGIKRPVTLLYCDAPVSPFTYGFFHPCVVITSIVSSELVPMAIRHELEHIRSWDFLFRMACFFVFLFHCINPFSYFLWKEFIEIQEETCDERITKHYSVEQIQSYGHFLIELTFLIQQKSSCVIPLIARKKHQIYRRVKRLAMCSRKKSIYVCFAVSLFCLIGFSIPVYACSPEVFYLGSDSITENVVSKDWVYISLEDDSTILPEDEVLFQNADQYVLLEDGTILYGPFVTADSQAQRSICAHTWKEGTYKDHETKSNGGCIVGVYSTLICTKCYSLKNLTLLYKTTYQVCPHT